jgi:prepilin-type N-terminal cleavage/methylation domain-containing protein
MSRFDYQQGFTLVELLIVFALMSIIGITAYSFTTTTFSDYLRLQQDGMHFGVLTEESHRIARVVRGSTDVVTATNTALSINSYFSPGDAYVSRVDYYKSPDGTKLLADVTPYTSNPPIGTLVAASKKTYTIIGNFYTPPSINTFVYLDSSGSVLTMPIADLHTVKGVRITFAVKASTSPYADREIKTEVSLRNRKTNL